MGVRSLDGRPNLTRRTCFRDGLTKIRISSLPFAAGIIMHARLLATERHEPSVFPPGNMRGRSRGRVTRETLITIRVNKETQPSTSRVHTQAKASVLRSSIAQSVANLLNFDQAVCGDSPTLCARQLLEQERPGWLSETSDEMKCPCSLVERSRTRYQSFTVLISISPNADTVDRNKYT